LPHNLSLALGSGAVTPWRMASAYCIFANGGYRVDPYYIDHIETYDGKSVYKADPLRVCHDCTQANKTGAASKVAANQSAAGQATASAGADPVVPSSPPPVQLKKPAPPGPRAAPRVINPQNIWIMDSMTRDVIRQGTGRRALVLNRTDLSGKTGTTNDQRDAWFAGFNPDVVTVCWVGFDNFSPLGNNETGARAALPMWIKYMRVALKDVPETILERPPHIMPRPDGLVDVRIDSKTGKLAGPDDPNAMFEVFKAGTAPKQTQDGGKSPFNDQGQGATPDQIF
jgi:penicillin-binding protein 1A